MDERSQKRDLVLAPGEYAYMQDVTKGVVKTYTGPTVINPTAQERPVVFDPKTKRFDTCALEEAVQVGTIAPEGTTSSSRTPRSAAITRRRGVCIRLRISMSAARSTSTVPATSRSGPVRS